MFWTRMADDGLLDPTVNLAWLIDTASLLAAAETYLLITRMTSWNLDTYQDWLAAALTRLSSPPPGTPAHSSAADCQQARHLPGRAQWPGCWLTRNSRRRPEPFS